MHSFINDGDPRIRLPNIFILSRGLSIFSVIRFLSLSLWALATPRHKATRRRLVNNHRSSTNSLMRENFNPLFHWRVFCTEVRWNLKLSNARNYPTSRAVWDCWYNKDHRIMFCLSDQREIFIFQLSDRFLYTLHQKSTNYLLKKTQPVLLLKQKSHFYFHK